MKPHEGPLIIKADIGLNSIVEKFMKDSGSYVDVLYYNTFIKMGYKREDFSPSKEPIFGSTNTAMLIEGVIDLKTSIGSKKYWVRKTTQFIYHSGSRVSFQHYMYYTWMTIHS